MSLDQSISTASVWDDFVQASRRFSETSRAFFSPGVDRVGIIRDSLESGRDAWVVANVLPGLSVEELKTLFPLLVRWCSVGHSTIEMFRDAVATLPREWVVGRIEEVAGPILDAGSDEEYRRLLELYWILDRGLTERFARLAMDHDDDEIREAGEDFLRKLDGGEPPDSSRPGEPERPSPTVWSRPQRRLAID